ncbi:MAG: transcriptional regulator, family [Chloroflexi bacterium]|nr:transcriptional regulator, family [Chloroflexota bacterium]
MSGSGTAPPSPDTAGFGVALRQFRLRQGLSQEELARRISYSRPHLANVERGALLPGRAFLPRIEAVFPGGGAALQGPYRAAQREQRRTRRHHAFDLDGDAADFAAGLGEEVVAPPELHDSVSLAGTWYALWETSAERRLSIDSEEVTVQQQGLTLTIENQSRAPENPLGSFLWRARCRVYDNRHILGMYVPREANVRSKGVVYLTLHTSGAFMLGRWLGCNYDDEVASGTGVIARDPEVARLQMCKRLPDAASLLGGLPEAANSV